MAAHTESIAWIGVGKMGLPIAGRIAAAGHQLTTSDASPVRIAAARQQGLTISVSATEAVAGRTVVFTSLPDDTALRAAVLAEEGLLSAMTPRSVLIETSTVSAEISAEVATAAGRRGID